MKKILQLSCLFLIPAINCIAQSPCTTTLTSAVGSDAQEVCHNTSIMDITYSVSGTDVSVKGLPDGLTGTFNANVFTISGMAADYGIYNSGVSTHTYTITTTGACLTDSSVTGTITIGADQIFNPSIYTPPYCKYNGSNPIPIATPGPPLPNPFLDGLMISPYFESTGNITFVDSISGEIDVNICPTGDYTIKHIILAHGGCPNDTILENIYISDGVSALFSYDQNIYCKSSISNPSPNFPIPIRAPSPGPGVFSEPTGGIVFVDTLTGEIDLANCTAGSYTITNTVKERNGQGCLTDVQTFAIKISDGSLPVSVNDVTMCLGQTATLTASGAVTYDWSNGVNSSTITVSPTTTTSYSVQGTTGTCSGFALATVTVYSDSNITLVRIGTDTQNVCKNTPIADIVYVYENGGIPIASGLPIGVTINANGSNDTMTISGTPTVEGTFTYTVSTGFGTCDSIRQSTGVITVGSGLITLGNQLQVICQNAAIEDIVFNIFGNGTTTVSGLPAGLNSSINGSNNTLTISGIPIVNGEFNYVVSTRGGSCPDANPFSGTIVVKPKTNASTAPEFCDGYYKISGTIYQDKNGNCAADSSDQGLSNISLKLVDSSRQLIAQTYSSTSGAYEFIVWDSIGSYTIMVDSLKSTYESNCGVSGYINTAIITENNPHARDVNFYLQCKDEKYEIRTDVQGRVFPGQTHLLKINAGNLNQWYNLSCPKNTPGKLVITIDGPVSFHSIGSGTRNPTIQNNVFTYDIADWSLVDAFNDFGLYLTTDTTAQSWDTICIRAELTNQWDDIITLLARYEFCYTVRNSYDPNIKEVYPFDVEPGFEDWFNYTIHFQNTGNANAINIRLQDTLDANLNLETFEVLGYSHACTISLYDNLLTIFYPNIELPDSASNPEGSQGHVQYRIKPNAALPLGTKINNTALIYFDYNPAIVTNTTVNEYVKKVVSINENEQEDNLNIYPNPFNASINVVVELPSTFALYNIQGISLYAGILDTGENSIDTKNLTPGLYFMSIENEKGRTTKKLIKN